jgi:hypothetical protein
VNRVSPDAARDFVGGHRRPFDKIPRCARDHSTIS